MIEPGLLQALAAVVREGGFEKAALALSMTQSAISQRLNRLEQALGQPVLTRSRPPRPTAAGQQALKHYAQWQLLQDELMRSLRGVDQQATQPLAIGVNADSLATWLIPALKPLLCEQQLSIEFVIDDQDHTEQLLRDGKVVGCISSRASALQGCAVMPLGVMSYVACATQEFLHQHITATFERRTAWSKQLLAAPVLVFNEKDRLQHQFIKAATGLTPAALHQIIAPSSQAFLDLTLASTAWGMIPLSQAQPYLEQRRLIRLAPKTSVDVTLYWHCWKLPSTLLQQLSRALQDGAQQQLLPISKRTPRATPTKTATVRT